ncbi:MAG TPA: hypothetical protein VLV83_14860 [Acidobacteriota bacterium]|nr:hypothetical protein [Acidobacteriota bacterium]
MAELVHTSKMQIFQEKRPNRRVKLEGFEQPIRFGVHSGIAGFYGLTPEEEHPATLDHLIAAVGG